MRVILGAGESVQDGWIATNEQELNLLDRQTFTNFFKDEKAEAMLAEHVWEHLTLEQGKLAAKNCFEFLADGGYIRVAVPDKNFRNEWYQNMVQVGGRTQRSSCL